LYKVNFDNYLPPLPLPGGGYLFFIGVLVLCVGQAEDGFPQNTRLECQRKTVVPPESATPCNFIHFYVYYPKWKEQKGTEA